MTNDHKRSRQTENESLPKKTFRLPEELDDEMAEAVEDGPYSNQSELIRDGINRVLDSHGLAMYDFEGDRLAVNDDDSDGGQGAT